MDSDGLDLRSIAMIGGFFIAGFIAVWVFLGLRQSEHPKRGPDEDRR